MHSSGPHEAHGPVLLLVLVVVLVVLDLLVDVVKRALAQGFGHLWSKKLNKKGVTDGQIDMIGGENLSTRSGALLVMVSGFCHVPVPANEPKEPVIDV